MNINNEHTLKKTESSKPRSAERLPIGKWFTIKVNSSPWGGVGVSREARS